MSGGQSRAAVISCDIVGHSRAHETEQLARVRDINALVRVTLERGADAGALWASGGDGGHVVFTGDDWYEHAVDLVRRLQQWALEQHVPLRLAGHVGTLATIEGADRRTQPVGEVINRAAWILERSSPAGMVVSTALRDEFQRRGLDIDFHSARALPVTDDVSIELCLMTLPGVRPASAWADPVEIDRARFIEALQRRNGWDVIYYAKRLLQMHSADEGVDEALAELDASCFRMDGQQLDNPIFNSLQDWEALRRLVRLGQLVERPYNEYLCRAGDAGDSMFVVLRGEVGAIRSDNALPSFVFRRGALFGELAFALGSRRTANLITLAETAMLGFDPRQVLTRTLHQTIWSFITARVLEHVGSSVPYLFGGDLAPQPSRLDDSKQQTSATSGGDKVAQLARMLLPGSMLVSLAEGERLSIARLRGLDTRCEEGGLYLLVGGSVRSATTAAKSLTGETFPLLYVDLDMPNGILTPDHRYDVRSDFARVLFIGRSAILGLGRRRHDVLEGLKRQLKDLYHYDAVVVYEPGDEWVADSWVEQFTAGSLRAVSCPSASAGQQGAGLPEDVVLDSLAVVLIVTPGAPARTAPPPRCRQAFDLRTAHFDNPCVLPVAWHGGDPAAAGFGYAAATTERGELAAFEAVISRVRRLREGADAAPFKERRGDDRGPAASALASHGGSGKPRPPDGGEPRYSVMLDMRGGTLGQLSLGGALTNINSRIEAVRATGDPRLAEALEAIHKSVAGAPELTSDQRSALVENVEDLAEQAAVPPDQRKRGRIKAALQAIKDAAGAAASVADAVNDWQDVLADLV